MNRLTNFINEKIDTRLILFLIFFISTFSFQLSANEENYLAYTKKVFFPDWMPYTPILNEFAGTRVLFQNLFGWLFLFFDFEAVAKIGRGLCCFLIIFPLSRIVKQFKISNLALLFLMPLWIPQQALFAGGWMIGSFETKVFAYIALLWSLHFLWKEKYTQSILFQIISFYCHILVGGWISIVIFFCMFRKIKFSAFKYYALYVFAVLPMVVYLYNGIFADSFNAPDVNLDWVYSYYRNPHHVAPFKSTALFFNNFFIGIAISIILFLVHLLVFKRSNNKVLKDLAFFNIALFLQQLITLAVAYFDTNGVFLKTYPFRTSVLFFLFSILQFAMMYGLNKVKIKNKIFGSSPSVIVLFKTLLPLIFIFSLTRLYYKKINGNLKPYKRETIETANFMRTTPADATFIFACKRAEFISLPRMSERNFYVFQKFVPTEKALLYNWYQKMLIQDQITDDISMLKRYYKKEGIDYLITDYEIDEEFVNLEYQNKRYFCYSLNG